MKKVYLFWFVALLLGGCTVREVSFQEYVPKAHLRFTPESRVALLWDGEMTPGSSSNFFYDERVENNMLLAAVDRELRLQSTGLFDYIPNRQLKQNSEEDFDRSQLKLIQDNQLDGALSTRNGVQPTIHWPEAIFSSLFSMNLTLWMSIRDQNNQEIAVVRVFFWGSSSSLEFPTPAHWETGPTGTRVRIPGTLWDKQAYYDAIAKLYVKKVLKFFKEGIVPREEVSSLVKRHKELTGKDDVRIFSDLEVKSLFKDGYPPLIPEP